MEIVAPTHSLECTLAAISAGADAVYCSGEIYHAREFFDVGCSIAELNAIRDLCSRMNAKYYLVFNAFPSELDWQECVKMLSSLLATFPDEVIVSSLGLIRWIRQQSDIPVVASVLSGTWDIESVMSLSKIGASAVTISRGARILASQENSHMPPLKAVAHGNLCSLVDGTCRLGSYLNGIRGRLTRQCKPHLIDGMTSTTNPCRRKYYDYANGHKVFFQRFPVQFSALSLIPKWSSCGVRAFKINGRTNSPDWIQKVVGVYREAIDSFLESPSTWKIKPQWTETLKLLVPTGKMETMPDPILELTLHEHS